MNETQAILTAMLKGKKQRHPFSYEVGKISYRDELEVRFDDYTRRIKLLKTSGPLTTFLQDNVDEIKDCCDGLLKSVDEYLSGSAGKAYDRFEQMMESNLISNHITGLKEKLVNYSVIDKSLYRVRVSDKDLTQRKDMFHIPFSLRQLVGTQRYSIAGLPCLYLGRSIYVCWQEMNKPSLDMLQISAFKLNADSATGNESVLDFSYSFESLKQTDIELLMEFSDNPTNEKLKAYFVFWPLLMSCSFIKAHDSASFNVEYVIPNLLLQWVSRTKRKIMGIMYHSTKTRQLRNHDIGLNFVIPPKIQSIKTEFEEYCPYLSKIFEYTKPVSWQIANTINDNKVRNESEFNITDDLEEEFVRSYRSTRFYKIENKINTIMSFKPLNDKSN